MRLFFLQLYDYLIIYFQSVIWQRDYLIIQIISFTVSILLITGVVYFFIKSGRLSKFKRFLMPRSAALPPKEIFKGKWGEILARLESGDEANLKLAVIEADKLVDNFLQKIGYEGDTMADRLKQMNSTQISNIREVWRAHRIRNTIVHDPDFQISDVQAEFVISTYQKTLEEFEAI